MASPEKLCLTVQGEELDAPLDGRFGRAERFLFVDGEGQVLAALDNPARHEDHGAGPAAAALLHQQGTTAVISGRFGPKALDMLSAFHITPWIAPDGVTARRALELWRAGELRLAEIKVLT